MKHKYFTIIIVCLTFALLLSLPKEARCDACVDVPTITIDRFLYSEDDERDKVRAAFTNFTSYYSSQNDRYELCFNFVLPLRVSSSAHTFTFNPAPPPNPANQKEIYIRGIELVEMADPGVALFTVDYSTNRVIVDEAQLSDVTSGIKVFQSEGIIKNASITARAGVTDGACVLLENSDNSVVESSTLSGCYVGALIQNSNETLLGSDNEATQSELSNFFHQNKTAINVKSGHGNKFKYNEFMENGETPYNRQQAVKIEPGANDDVGYPVVERFSTDNGNVLFHCDYDENDKVKTRVMKVNKTSGSLQIYAVDTDYHQPYQYITSCDVNSKGLCDLTNIPGGQFTEDNCGIPTDINNPEDYYITALHTDYNETLDTEYNSSEFMPEEFPDGDVVFQTGGFVQTTPGSGAREEAPTGGGLGGDDTGTEVSNVLATGAAGGCMKSGASIMPNDISKTVAPSLGMWWIIFGVALLGGIRLHKIRIKRRK